MGGTISKKKCRYYYYSEKDVRNLKEKEKIMKYEREIMVFTFKEANWKQEREKLKDEVMNLKKMIEEKEETIKALQSSCVAVNAVNSVNGGDEKEWEKMGTKLLVETMKEERARRDEAVEKWKQLYLAIKNELDDLIQRTYDGEGLYWKAEEKEVHMENMKKELQDKEGTIKILKAELDSMEQEKIKKEREFDLLRQSLRIMNGKKSSIQTKEKKKKLMKSKHGR